MCFNLQFKNILHVGLLLNALLLFLSYNNGILIEPYIYLNH